MEQADDARWMREAVKEGEKGMGLTSPNPPVGAVIVRDGQELARGWHRKAGAPHAEREAMQAAREAGHALRGATVYVTLEPCSTHGKTPPCTQGLMESGVARVVYGVRDPNPEHAGRADALLELAGVAVTHGVEEAACRRLLRGFEQAMTRERPWILAKTAQSLDGRITRPEGEGAWLTGDEARADVQGLRASVDAMLTSGETIRRDDPALSLRIPHPHGEKPPLWRVVVTRGGILPPNARVFCDNFASMTLVAQMGGGGARPADLPEAVGFQCFAGWQELMTHLVRECGVHRLMVEGGGRLMGVLFDARLIDEWVAYFAPMLCGGGVVALAGAGSVSPATSPQLEDVQWSSHGQDVRVRGVVRYSEGEDDAGMEDPARKLRPAVFFDRDGVVNDPAGQYYVTRWEDFHFSPGIFEAMRAAKAAGYALVCVTSQRGVGKGEMRAAALEDIHSRMQAELAQEGCAFEAIHAYTGKTPDGPGAKPDPLFVLQAARELGLDLGCSWVVGDADRDIEMGRRAGLRTIRVRGEKPIGVPADFEVPSVPALAELISQWGK